MFHLQNKVLNLSTFTTPHVRVILNSARVEDCILWNGSENYEYADAVLDVAKIRGLSLYSIQIFSLAEYEVIFYMNLEQIYIRLTLTSNMHSYMPFCFFKHSY